VLAYSHWPLQPDLCNRFRREENCYRESRHQRPDMGSHGWVSLFVPMLHSIPPHLFHLHLAWTLTLGNRKCLSVLQGHTSLVGQLQMRNDILVTGGSDGSVRVWSLTDYQAIHRLAAHDNSVTSLQFDNSRIVSGGSDGRVKVWDLKKGTLVRELSQPAEAVWRVVFEEEKCVIMASRNGRTVMEVSTGLKSVMCLKSNVVRIGMVIFTSCRSRIRGLPIRDPRQHARSHGLR
jgi:hypothetical protein